MLKKAWYYVRSYVFNVALALDRLLNAILLGDPEETVSHRLARYLVRSRNPSALALTLAWVLELIDPGHLQRVYKHDADGKELWRW